MISTAEDENKVGLPKECDMGPARGINSSCFSIFCNYTNLITKQQTISYVWLIL